MPWSERDVGQATNTLRANDLSKIPREAWNDVQETATLAWRAWVNLFPNEILWDPFGAALTLSLIVGLIIWLIKIRPG
jgi:hypothetical protein